MTDDHKSLTRNAKYLTVQVSYGSGIPPTFSPTYATIFDAKIENFIDNINAMPSEVIVSMAFDRWNHDTALSLGDKIKIYGEDDSGSKKTLFIGYITKILQQFSGGKKGGKYERLGFQALDSRWLLSVTSPIYGQYGIGQDDEDGASYPIPGEYTHFGGKRCVFNPKGIPNRFKDGIIIREQNMPCFMNPDIIDPYSNFWNLEDMVRYILSPLVNKAYDYWPIDPDDIFTTNRSEWLDWIKIHNDISIEGLNPMTALQTICKRVGWAFNLTYDYDDPKINLFKAGANMRTMHSLYAPPPETSKNDNNVKAAVAAGKVLVESAHIETDISNVVNAPILLGAPYRFEFTAELVPGWEDGNFEFDDSDDGQLFFSEVDLQSVSSPNDYIFYKYYHSQGAEFKREVGRIWALNETGRYSLNTTYDRGNVFDLTTIAPQEYIYDSTLKKNIIGFFDHNLLPCLTLDSGTQSSVGIIVQFSFDGGQNWQSIPASIMSLEGQAGIYISEANLSEIKPKPTTNIEDESSSVSGAELNYFTSLCRDKGFHFSQWYTRVRVTASIQLESRLQKQILPESTSGSPFYQADVIDNGNNFIRQKRADSSIFHSTETGSNDQDDSEAFEEQLKHLRNTLQDAAVSGLFVLERLWLDKFHAGDTISGIEGRDYTFVTCYGNQTLYPEIVQVIYLPQKQKMQLITHDLRFSEKR